MQRSNCPQGTKYPQDTVYKGHQRKKKNGPHYKYSHSTACSPQCSEAYQHHEDKAKARTLMIPYYRHALGGNSDQLGRLYKHADVTVGLMHSESSLLCNSNPKHSQNPHWKSVCVPLGTPQHAASLGSKTLSHTAHMHVVKNCRLCTQGHRHMLLHLQKHHDPITPPPGRPESVGGMHGIHHAGLWQMNW
eukprot:3934795-Rhodomonas_salina.1